MFGPTLVGDIITLRPLRITEEEAAVACAWFEDTTVTEYLSRMDPPTVEQELEWMRSKQADTNCVTWGIELEERLVGVGGAEAIDWRHGHGTLGIVIGDRSAWRGGVASEAGRLVVGDLFSFTELNVLRAGFIDGNQGSKRLQAKLGLVEVGRWPKAFRRHGMLLDHVLTAITREHFETWGSAPRGEVPTGAWTGD